MIYLWDLEHFLNTWWNVPLLPPEQNGIYFPSQRPVQRLGLALEPTPALIRQVTENRLDAVFLHRPWKLNLTQWPAGIGILAYHAAFDEHLTVGYNPTLAALWHMSEVIPFGEKAGRPLGMQGTIPTQTWEDFLRLIHFHFGPTEAIAGLPPARIGRVAFVGAINEALVRAAAEAKVDVYVTGQLRQPARKAIALTGLAVIATGHRQSELFGLNLLREKLRQAFSELELVLL